MMQSLEKKAWKKFEVFGENGFLHIVATSSSVDSIRLKEGSENIVPYITRSDLQNGVTRFVSTDNYQFGSDEGGCITVGLDTQTAFYQPHRFITGQNIHIVTGALLDKNTALFYITILRNQMKAKFNWGGNGATLGRMERLEALLPVNESDEIDIQFVKNYSRNTLSVMGKRYRLWLESRLVDLGDVTEIEGLSRKKWRPIPIIKMFRLVRGKEGNMARLLKGRIPLVSARNTNNGLKGFIENPKKIIAGHCITLNNDGDGGAGLAYYQPSKMALDTHVTALFPKYAMSEFTMLFISKCLSGLHEFFGHGLSISNKRAEKIKIMLPINVNNEPDYIFMEHYVKNAMIKKYRQYLDFLEGKQKPHGG